MLVEAAHREAGIALDPVARRVGRARIRGMQRERMARHRRAVRRAVVGQEAVEADQGAGLCLQRHGGTVVRPGCRIQLFHGDGVAVTQEAFAQRAAVPARFGPQAAVVHGRVFEREPEGGHGDRVAVEEGGILVPAHLAADARLLEDVELLALCTPCR